MNFSIDKQSLDELNLMGKFRQGSVYHLFNQVKTRSGEKLLDKFFRNPLTSADEINSRTAVFSFFQSLNIQFPFDSGQVALMQEYVDLGNRKGLAQSYLNIVFKKGLSSIARDDNYKKIIQGLQASIVTLKKCYSLVEELSITNGPYQQRLLTIKKELTSETLSQLLNTDIYKTIPLLKIAQYDYLLRSRLNAGIQDILLFIAEIDVNIAVSNIAKLKGFNYARALPKNANSLQARNLRHPCIENAIGNNIDMQSYSNVVFLTGANMAGKSTWMKTIGIAVYLAHIGFPVAADAMMFSVREGIFSSINVADNIGLGYSHFYAEVVRVKDAADATSTGRHLLLIFDELFKGTNVKDAYDGTLAVTEAFSEYSNCLFIVSTHIIEVGEALKSHENIQFKYMPTTMEGVTPRYTYRLQDGITEDRQGMMIIRNERILEMLESKLL